MKELIEKLEQKIKNHREISKKRGVKDDFYLMANLEILKEIQKQESKPLNPKDLGFKELKTSWYEKKLKGGFECDLIKSYKDNEWILSYYIEGQLLNPLYILTLKIPNHRFGVELLRSLGVIDAD